MRHKDSERKRRHGKKEVRKMGSKKREGLREEKWRRKK